METGGGTATAGRSIAGLAIRGAAALGARQLVMGIVAVVGTALLARFLEPAEFGVYGVVSALLAFLLVFGDGGLAVALVRQPDPPTERDLRQVLSVQLAVFGALATALVVGSWLLAEASWLPDADLLVVRLVALALLLQVFQTVPVVLLERRLDFARVGLVSVAEVLVFYGAAVALAAQGAGAAAVGVALVAQAAVGALLATALTGWRPALTRSWDGMGRRLRFSVLYQASNLVSLAKDSVTPVLVGLTLGAAAVGYVSWALGLAAFTVIGLAPLARLYLPVFARLQDDPRLLGRAVEVSLRVTNALTAPLAVVVLVLAPEVTDVVYGSQWRPGLAVFWFLWLANLVVPTAQPLFALLNARGRAGTTFRLSVLWMVTTWLLTPPLLLWQGLAGFGLANAGVQLTNALLVRAARQEASFSVLRPFVAAWLPAAAVAGGLLLARSALDPGEPVVLVAMAGVAGCAYLALSWPLQRTELRWAMTLVRR